jgi:hypothetical protein
MGILDQPIEEHLAELKKQVQTQNRGGYEGVASSMRRIVARDQSWLRTSVLYIRNLLRPSLATFSQSRASSCLAAGVYGPSLRL